MEARLTSGSRWLPRPTPATAESLWWGGEDLNLRRLRRQIYSLLPLATRAPPHATSFAEANSHDTQRERYRQGRLLGRCNPLVCHHLVLPEPLRRQPVLLATVSFATRK